MTEGTDPPEAVRLEQLWAGEFGDAYVARNSVLDERRATFWRSLIGSAPIRTVLEIGCGQGGNLRPLSGILEASDIWGIDVNAAAIERSRQTAPGTNAVHSVARNRRSETDGSTWSSRWASSSTSPRIRSRE